MKNSKKNIVITGMGLVSPLGTSIKEFWKNSIAGKSGVRAIDTFSIPKGKSAIAGIVPDFFPDSLRIDLPYENIDRMSHFANHAVQAALTSAKLTVNDLTRLGSRVGIVLSSAVGQIIGMERVFRQRTQNGTIPLNVAERFIHQSNPFLFNNIVNELSQKFGIKGRAMLLPTGCAGGVDAIAYAMHALRNNYCDIIITGACEAPITPLVIAAFSKIGATSTEYNHSPEKASRPFDRDRDGFVLGEGCGIVVMESEEHAQKRQVKILAEVAGTGSVNNCFHMTDIPQEGKPIAQASLYALNDANVLPEQIDFINSHGSSTPQNDVAETNAFNILFGKRVRDIPVTSNKSLLGHALAASNALETISSVMSLQDNIIPPTINLENQDARCELNVVGNTARSVPINCILKTSSGFSGIHSSLVIKRYQG